MHAAVKKAIADARRLLEVNGYVVVTEKSHRAATRRHEDRAADLHYAEKHAERAQEWARECRAEERRLADRCTLLAGLAAAHGADLAEFNRSLSALESPVEEQRGNET